MGNTHVPEYGNTRWAAQLVSAQDGEGKWGRFHSLAAGQAVTTEQALRRLARLGFMAEDECIARAIEYMRACLRGEREIPDAREKLPDWDVFVSLMLAARIREFTRDVPEAERVAGQWAEAVTRAFEGGEYDDGAYRAAFMREFGLQPRGGRLKDFTSCYQLALLAGMLDASTERALLRHVLAKPDGIYYVYEARLLDTPQELAGRRASRYIAALELLARYECAPDMLGFAAAWLEDGADADGTWDLGSAAADGAYLPLSDSWRCAGARRSDCTRRIGALLARLTRNNQFTEQLQKKSV